MINKQYVYNLIGFLILILFQVVIFFLLGEGALAIITGLAACLKMIAMTSQLYGLLETEEKNTKKYNVLLQTCDWLSIILVIMGFMALV